MYDWNNIDYPSPKNNQRDSHLMKWSEIIRQFVDDTQGNQFNWWVTPWSAKKIARKTLVIKWSVKPFEHLNEHRYGWVKRFLRKIFLRAHLKREALRKARFEDDLEAFGEIFEFMSARIKGLNVVLITDKDKIVFESVKRHLVGRKAVFYDILIKPVQKEDKKDTISKSSDLADHDKSRKKNEPSGK